MLSIVPGREEELSVYTIQDPNNNIVATVEVTEYEPGRFEGFMLSSAFPEELAALLREYERLVNDQILPLLDEIEEKIDGYHLLLHERDNARIVKLQLWEEREIRFCVEDRHAETETAIS